MISGSPGIGKTSMVKLIAEHVGFGIMEINASDKRSKKVIEELLTIIFYMKQRRCVIIFLYKCNKNREFFHLSYIF